MATAKLLSSPSVQMQFLCPAVIDYVIKIEKKKKETKFPLQIYRITITKHGSYFSSNCKD